MELFCRIVIKTFITQIEDEIKFPLHFWQFRYQGVMLVKVDKMITLQLCQSLFQFINRKKIVVIKIGLRFDHIRLTGISHKNNNGFCRFFNGRPFFSNSCRNKDTFFHHPQILISLGISHHFRMKRDVFKIGTFK